MQYPAGPGKRKHNVPVRARRRCPGKRTAQMRRKSSTGKSADSTQRMFWQLAVSVVLFLVVYIGRGIAPEAQEKWQAALEQDTDFSSVLLAAEDAVQQGDTPGQILGNLSRLLLHQDTAPSNTPEGTGLPDSLAHTFQDTVQHNGGRRMGIATLQQNLMGNYPAPGESPNAAPPMTASPAPTPLPSPTEALPSPTPEITATPTESPAPAETPVPTEQVVTAMAQEYNEAGERLPSNVSMQYYPLGLERTVNPVDGPISSTFGYRISPITYQKEFHLALDIAVPDGTPVKAFSDGVVEYIGMSDDFGLYLSILHDNNVSSFYAHCSQLLVQQGQSVTCGEVVAYSGHTGNVTGPHLHFLITKDQIRLNPIHYVDL